MGSQEEEEEKYSFVGYGVPKCQIDQFGGFEEDRRMFLLADLLIAAEMLRTQCFIFA